MAEQWRVGRRNPHTVYRQHGDEPRGMEHGDHDDSLGYFRHGHDAQLAVVGVAALAALAELVALKDGDRDEEYERRKPLAWSRAREVLGIPEETTVPQPQDDEQPPDFAVDDTEHHHCCEEMTKRLAETCEQHPYRWHCPDLLVTGPPESSAYGLWVHDGGSSYITIRHCPWCGSLLNERTKLTDEDAGWYEANESLGEGLTAIGMELGLPKPRTGATWGVAEVLRRVDEVMASRPVPDAPADRDRFVEEAAGEDTSSRSWLPCGEPFAHVAAAGGEMPAPLCELPRGHDPGPLGGHGWLNGRVFAVVEVDPQTREPLAADGCCDGCGLCSAYGHLRCWLHADDGGDTDLRALLCEAARPALAPTVVADGDGALPDGSLGLAEWRHEDGDRVTVTSDREVVVWPGRGHYALAPGWFGWAVLAAEHWAEHLAPLERGEQVTGDRAVSAPVGTTLRCTTAEVVAFRHRDGWQITGWTAESDPEHAVRINTWRIVDTPGGGRDA